MVTIRKVRNLLLCLAIFGASSLMAEQKFIKLNLSINDVKTFNIVGSNVWIKLTKEPTIKLSKITTENIGNSLEITINAIPVVRSTIQAKIDSGQIVAVLASKKLLNLLKSLPPTHNKSK